MHDSLVGCAGGQANASRLQRYENDALSLLFTGPVRGELDSLVILAPKLRQASKEGISVCQ